MKNSAAVGWRLNVICLALAGVMLATCIAMSLSMSRDLLARKEKESLLYVPSGKFLRAASLDYNEALADVMWLKAITYFGDHALGDRQYPWLINWIDAIITLDPKWEFPYHFAGIVLSVEAKQARDANHLLVKGMENFPDTWQLPFYIGFNYFHVMDNARCGAKYIFRASTMPNAPAYLPALAAKLSSQGNNLENHMMMCGQLLRMTKDPALAKQIKKNCDERLQKGDVATDAKTDEEACL